MPWCHTNRMASLKAELSAIGIMSCNSSNISLVHKSETSNILSVAFICSTCLGKMCDGELQLTNVEGSGTMPEINFSEFSIPSCFVFVTTLIDAMTQF